MLPVATLPLATLPLDTLPLDTLPLATLPLDTLPLATLPLDTLPLATLPSARPPPQAAVYAFFLCVRKGCVKVKYSGATRARSLCFISPGVHTSDVNIYIHFSLSAVRSLQLKSPPLCLLLLVALW